ncbi:MAG: hypothetical protein JRG86_09785 [Deltaproteobacteria bacterium]|jgi:hypothetical protein|nr:hypothetical protein [Deltaproteobacteria bacterium]MBW2499694.1 hypothetical protein [Deltaproteobacteria bacterium]
MPDEARPIVGLDPTSGPLERRDERVLASRPRSLDGQVVAFVTNGLGRSEDFMNALGDEIARLTQPTGAIHVLKSSVSVAPEPADWARLTSEASVAITGFGG